MDIFDALNMLNQSLQGRDVTVCGSIAKLKAFIAKLRLWRGNIHSDTLAMFSNVTEYIDQNPRSKTDKTSSQD